MLAASFLENACRPGNLAERNNCEYLIFKSQFLADVRTDFSVGFLHGILCAFLYEMFNDLLCGFLMYVSVNFSVDFFVHFG